MKLGVTRELPLDVKTALHSCFDEIVVYEKGRPLTENELCEAVKGKDVLICQLTDLISEKVLSHATSLKHLCTFSTGIDHLDLSALKKRGIRISHTPGVLTEATANLSWALILNCARKIKPAEAFLKEGRFKGFFPNLFLGLPLELSTLGIVGMGKIGEAVAARAQAFKMKRVLYVSKTSKNIVGATPVTFDELIRLSDVISIHCPLTTETRHLFNDLVFKKMKKNAILVNTARGAIIDEAALTSHLISHPDFTVGLDVFEKEPEVFSGLLNLPNALCVPHIGSASVWAREKMAEICIEDAMRFASGTKPKYEYLYD